MLIIVEDDIIDFMLLAEAAKSLNYTENLIHRTTAAETLALLRQLLAENHPLDTVTLLVDLNLHTSSGFDIIERLQLEEAFRAVEVYVWSSSNADSDLGRAAKLGVKSYFVKSTRQADNVALLEQVLHLVPPYQQALDRAISAEHVT